LKRPFPEPPKNLLDLGLKKIHTALAGSEVKSCAARRKDLEMASTDSLVVVDVSGILYRFLED